MGKVLHILIYERNSFHIDWNNLRQSYLAIIIGGIIHWSKAYMVVLNPIHTCLLLSNPPRVYLPISPYFPVYCLYVLLTTCQSTTTGQEFPWTNLPHTYISDSNPLMDYWFTPRTLSHPQRVARWATCKEIFMTLGTKGACLQRPPSEFQWPLTHY